jgi:16S rRNA (guanine966-N2)-methyltransferase
VAAEEAELLRMPAERALRTARERGDAYDLVFLDPPYRQAPALGERLAADLAAVLAPAARVVTESDRRAPLDLPLPTIDERRYGDTLIRIHAT